MFRERLAAMAPILSPEDSSEPSFSRRRPQGKCSGLLKFVIFYGAAVAMSLLLGRLG